MQKASLTGLESCPPAVTITIAITVYLPVCFRSLVLAWLSIITGMASFSQALIWCFKLSVYLFSPCCEIIGTFHSNSISVATETQGKPFHNEEKKKVCKHNFHIKEKY